MDEVSQEAREAGLINVRDADHALQLMDEVDNLVRFCSVRMLDADRYARGSWAFWSVCHWIARNRQSAGRGEVDGLRSELNKVRGILERLRDFDGWQGTFHAGHAYDAKQDAVAYLEGTSHAD